MENVSRAPARPVLTLLLALVAASHGGAATAEQSSADIPALTAPVNDFARVIDADSERELDRRIRALKNATGDVVVVATVPTFKPYATIEEYAVKMFENGGRGIGEKGKDNGLLLVVAVEDRKVRIETGYDIEGAITDGFAGQTIREVIAPAFRAGRYGPGLVAAATRLITRIAETRGATLENVPATPQRAADRPRSRNLAPLIVLIIFLILASRSRRRRRRHWGGGPWSGWNSGVGPFGGGFGGFGGGFGGFGGGGGGRSGGFGGFSGGRSGGGGASGGW
jgi:uncharacterized protein